MTALLLTVHFIVAVAMIGTILLQRSEGGALGLGGGGGVSSLMSGRGAANALSRSTVILAAIFIATSLALAMVAKANRSGGSVLVPATNSQPGTGTIPLLPGSHPPAGSAPTAPGSAPAAPLPLVPTIPVPAQPGPTPSPTAPAPSSAPAGQPPSGSTSAPAPASGGGH